MAEDLAKDLAACTRGLVVAPAGCGKTHLISEAVKHCNGRQLVLTHTHAGVKAIRDRMIRLKVPAEQYRISTIDSFALRYAAAFPTVSEWTNRRPEKEQWKQLRPAASKVLNMKFAEDVLRASYEGVFVDEYQDCTKGQHELVLQLASVLPCRVLGDPLQSVFWSVNKTEALSWRDVERCFPVVGELNYPHRWAKKNEALGKWLLTIREALLAGEVIDFRRAPGISVQECVSTQQFQLAACQNSIRLDGKIFALRKFRPQCWSLAGYLNNAFATFEDAECEELLKFTRKLDDIRGTERVQELAAFAENWLSRLPKKAVDAVVNSVLENLPSKARRPDLLRLFNAFVQVRDNDDFRKIALALDAYEVLNEQPVFKSREVWSGLRKAVSNYAPSIEKSLHQTAWQHRNVLRRVGRNPARRCLATPLLVKGLECDHTLILDASDFPDAESLYVCLTRASRSITVLARSSRIRAMRSAN